MGSYIPSIGTTAFPLLTCDIPWISWSAASRSETLYCICNANTRIEVIHTDLLCDCCCTVAATKQRARKLAARSGTDDVIRQQQHTNKSTHPHKHKRPWYSTQHTRIYICYVNTRIVISGPHELDVRLLLYRGCHKVESYRA